MVGTKKLQPVLCGACFSIVCVAQLVYCWGMLFNRMQRAAWFAWMFCTHVYRAAWIAQHKKMYDMCVRSVCCTACTVNHGGDESRRKSQSCTHTDTCRHSHRRLGLSRRGRGTTTMVLLLSKPNGPVVQQSQCRFH